MNEVFFSHWGVGQWALAAFAAYLIGLSKSGWGGLGMLTVVIMASLMKGQERESTGVVLPLLIAGDLMAVRAYRGQANWPQVLRILPPAALGVVLGYFILRGMSSDLLKPVIGWIVLALTLLQWLRQRCPQRFAGVPESRGFAWAMGTGAGVTTMLANAAGPMMGLYFLAIGLPKLQLVGTAAWYFLTVNLFKVPFSAQLGLIGGGSLLFNLCLLPAVAAGILSGRAILRRVNQTFFERFLLLTAALAALHLILF
ncbi:MAG TPA: sulfite exporter TauE/SafE family protein [Chthoniobacteraceae bacterium]|nr:sulfite exporter TauE/SafE family protein [Chthoniobacteraceae bacterium]